jgi:hypothetical protein
LASKLILGSSKTHKCERTGTVFGLAWRDGKTPLRISSASRGSRRTRASLMSVHRQPEKQNGTADLVQIGGEIDLHPHAGTITVGVILLLLIVAWAAKRIIRRPERTVWLPATT